jgi:hypothetical protein
MISTANYALFVAPVVMLALCGVAYLLFRRWALEQRRRIGAAEMFVEAQKLARDHDDRAAPKRTRAATEAPAR